MGTGIDQRSVRSRSTGGSSRSCHASCCAVPVISMPVIPMASTLPAAAATMAAVSADPAPARPGPPGLVTAVPHRMRLICAATAAVVVAVLVLAAVFLKHSSTGVVSFGSADQWAMAGIGLVLGAGIAFLGRSRVDADADGIRVQNI